MHQMLVKNVSGYLRDYGLTLSSAESCTGGLIAASMTELEGASDVFVGGAVTYTNDVKAKLVGVSDELLEKYGAVSEQVARAMAEGVRVATGSDFGVSTTGLAGPGGDDRGNPVGTVFIAVSCDSVTVSTEHHFMGDRSEIRSAAVKVALEQVLWRVLDMSR